MIRTTHRRIRILSTAAIALLAVTRAFADPAVEVTLTRLDCGTSAAPSDVARFSDTYAYNGLKIQLTYSCYLIRHGDEYMLWDTGNPATG